MLSHILRQVQDFERRHGQRPNVVFVNEDHLAALQADYPRLFRQDPVIELGFRIAVVSNLALTQPEAAWLPERIEPRRATANAAA